MFFCRQTLLEGIAGRSRNKRLRPTGTGSDTKTELRCDHITKFTRQTTGPGSVQVMDVVQVDEQILKTLLRRHYNAKMNNLTQKFVSVTSPPWVPKSHLKSNGSRTACILDSSSFLHNRSSITNTPKRAKYEHCVLCIHSLLSFEKKWY